jgi:hypothetical protein
MWTGGLGLRKRRITWPWVAALVVVGVPLLLYLFLLLAITHVDDGYRSVTYTSVQEAEQAAGFHIPAAGSEYSVTDTYLERWGDDGWPSSHTSYAVAGVANRVISVIVEPHDYLDTPRYTFVEDGTPTTIGGRAGWIIGEDEAARWRTLVFVCGTVDDLKVWCEVSAHERHRD